MNNESVYCKEQILALKREAELLDNFVHKIARSTVSM